MDIYINEVSLTDQSIANQYSTIDRSDVAGSGTELRAHVPVQAELDTQPPSAGATVDPQLMFHQLQGGPDPQLAIPVSPGI